MVTAVPNIEMTDPRNEVYTVTRMNASRHSEKNTSHRKLFRVSMLAMMALGAPLHSDEYLTLNGGLLSGKTTLGAAYHNKKHSINAGIMGFEWISSYGITGVHPGVSYSYRLTENGYFSNIGTLFGYSKYSRYTLHYDTTSQQWRQENTGSVWKWNDPFIFIGGGKSFQFSRWSIHFDVNAFTPTGKHLFKEVQIAPALGFTYRMREL